MNKRPTIVIMGSAGSGKGTQSSLLEEQLGYHVLEAGGILRNLMKEDTEQGRHIKDIINSGRHLTDEEITEIMKPSIKAVPVSEGILIDGYPRSIKQAEMLESVLDASERSSDDIIAVWIRVKREEALDRLLNRSECSVCKTVFMNRDTNPCPHCGGEVKPREYDQPESINKRLDFFEDHVVPAIERYREQGKLIEVDGMQEVSQVFESIRAAIESR